ncbi:MAG TPA: MerR family transcriptional regulator [Treponemataceae bacterium]|nr:MerR family transcriptional regulator [Treponemataceae bacterium]
MAEYSIGEVERMTGIRAHVLRYWEEAIPFIRPRKDDEGRRYYGDVDVRRIVRVKELVEVERYTLAGAGERLVAELAGEVADGDKAANGTAREMAREIREKLMTAYAVIQERKSRETGTTDE